MAARIGMAARILQTRNWLTCKVPHDFGYGKAEVAGKQNALEDSMKKLISLFVVAVSVSITACQSMPPLKELSYSKLVGEWLVDLNSRPQGWQDTKYVFSDRKIFEIYYGSKLAFRADVIGADELDIGVNPTYSVSNGPLKPMKMCYALDNGDSTMKLGWYTGFSRVYYLDFTRK